MKYAPTPTTLTASFAGAFAGLVMPVFWTKFGNDTTTLVVSFLLVVAFPAHAFVVGFRRDEADEGLVKRVVAWLGAAIVTMAVTRMGGA